MTEAGGPWPLEIRVKRGEQRLEVDFDDGTTFSYPAELLRVESPSAEVQGHVPSQKVTVARQAQRRHRRGSSRSATTPCGSCSTTATAPASTPGPTSTASAATRRRIWGDYVRALEAKGLSRDG